MTPEFVIVAPHYDENSGGSIALHHLCHLINESGGSASITKVVPSLLISPLHWQIPLRTVMRSLDDLAEIDHEGWLGLNPRLRTPVCRDLRGISNRENLVVVYPEIVAGNPLRARHVARWLLFEPGAHSGEIFFSRGEVQFLYSRRFPSLQGPGLETAPDLLDLLVVPWTLYEAPAGLPRAGTAYAVRKGKGKPMVHDPAGAVCIDGMPHEEVAEVFRRVKTFVSYDPHTLYSALAVVAGCDSVVIPDPGVTIKTWSPDPMGRAGIAYGFKDLPRARATRDALISALQRRDDQNLASVRRFIEFWTHRLGVG